MPKRVSDTETTQRVTGSTQYASHLPVEFLKRDRGISLASDAYGVADQILALDDLRKKERADYNRILKERQYDQVQFEDELELHIGDTEIVNQLQEGSDMADSEAAQQDENMKVQVGSVRVTNQYAKRPEPVPATPSPNLPTPTPAPASKIPPWLLATLLVLGAGGVGTIGTVLGMWLNQPPAAATDTDTDTTIRLRPYEGDE